MSAGDGIVRVLAGDGVVRVLADPVPGEAGREAARRELDRIGHSGGGGFGRAWSQFIAFVADHVPGGEGGLLVLTLLLIGAVIALVRFWPHVRGLNWKLRRRGKAPKKTDAAEEVEAEETPDEEVPELPPAQLLSRADRYAAEGRYAEAVRERLRAIVRTLVERGVIEHHPGWTVTELATAAGQTLPPLGPPLAEAGRIFSDIWYGEYPAGRAQDARMRELAGAVDAGLTVGAAR